MDGMLSQEEINALLGNVDADSTSEEAASDAVQTSSDISKAEKLTPEESDALGEISNISMGTAATTLSILVNNRVDITTPTVSYTTLEELSAQCEAPVVFIYISYKTGLQGKNLLILKERDVKVITDLMMGGDGTNVDDTELSDLHLSAICEAMNQMMGSAATQTYAWCRYLENICATSQYSHGSVLRQPYAKFQTALLSKDHAKHIIQFLYTPHAFFCTLLQSDQTLCRQAFCPLSQ